MKPSHYKIAAAVILGAGTAFALAHGIAGMRYAGFTPQEYAGLFKAPSMALDFFLAGLWAVGAFALIVRRSAAAFIVAGLGALAMLAHGFLFSLTTTTPIGLVFILGAALLAFLLKRAWTPTEPTRGEDVPRASRLSCNS